MKKLMKKLICCCCGKYTKGKQWYNRDKGYGICPDCAKWVKETGTSKEEMISSYGHPGINYLEE